MSSDIDKIITLTAEEQLRAKMYKKTLAQQNIVNRSNYEYLKGVIAETEQEADPIKAYIISVLRS